MTIYNHSKKIHEGDLIKEVVFGVEDGMVSTLGALTGISIGSGDINAVILAGMVIIAVESISMGVGSYLASKTKQSTDDRKLREENEELKNYPKAEQKELEEMFIRDGWSKKLVSEMMKEVVLNKKLMLSEMAYRELGIFSEKPVSATKNGLFMFFSYIFGGLIPLVSYFIFPTSKATVFSVVFSLIGLFALGAITTKYTSESWYRSGFRILLLGGVAMTVGLFVGEAFSLTH